MLKGYSEPQNRWVGMKYVARNADANQRVHLELWLDENADGNWRMLSQTDDTQGAWAAEDPSINGCTGAPFNYTADQLLSWAGPWVTFRTDSMAIDFKQPSVREVDPL